MVEIAIYDEFPAASLSKLLSDFASHGFVESNFYQTEDRLNSFPWNEYYGWREVHAAGSVHYRFLRPASVNRTPAIPAKAMVINLERRPDRWQIAIEEWKRTGLPSHLLERFDAFDGSHPDMVKDLLHDEWTRWLFDLSTWRGSRQNPYQDHGFVFSVLGCTMSHYRVWERIVSDDSLEDLDAVMVLEDDVFISEDFPARWDAVQVGGVFFLLLLLGLRRSTRFLSGLLTTNACNANTRGRNVTTHTNTHHPNTARVYTYTHTTNRQR